MPYLNEKYGKTMDNGRTHDIPRGSLVPIRTEFAKFLSKCMVPILTKWDQNASKPIRTEMPENIIGCVSIGFNPDKYQHGANFFWISLQIQLLITTSKGFYYVPLFGSIVVKDV